MLFSEIREKEVVCLESGARLGLIDDFEFDPQTASIQRFVIYGRNEMLGLGARLEDVTVEWRDVEKIGTDIILVKNAKEAPAKPRKKGFLGL